MPDRVAFQGEFGAFSEEAVRCACGPGVQPLPCRSLRDVFEAVESGRAALGVIPIENSSAGSVLESYDLLLERSLTIRAEVTVPVEQCLLAAPGTSLADVRRVYSHPQALAQCEAYLRALGVEAVAVYDTAGSARDIARGREPGAAAIASARAAELYGLEILARGVQADPDNTTRFYVVGPPAPAAPAPGRSHRTVVALALRDEDSPGALFWSLAVLAYWRVNLLKIESRPSRVRPWHYLFYLDLAAHADEPACSAALRELQPRTTLLRVLGSFPAAPPGPPASVPPSARPGGAPEPNA